MDDRQQPQRLTARDLSGISQLRPHESELEAALARRMHACIRGADFPLEVQFAMDYFRNGDGLCCRTRVLPSQPPEWPEPVMTVEACYRFHFEQFRETVIERIHSDVRKRRYVFSKLVALAEIDPHRGCELAAEFFSERLASPENELDDERRLPLFVLFLHDVDPALPADEVRCTRARSSRAADRLRALLLEAMDEPQCADELGLLAAQALREWLQEA